MTHFHLLDAAAPGRLRLWPADPAAPVAFAAPEAPPVWSVSVSADPAQAQAQLAAGLAQVAETDAALTAAQARLEALARAAAGDTPVSFAAPGTPLPPAEQDLLSTLEALHARAQGEVSFGLLPAQLGLAEASEQFQTALQRLIDSLAYYAVVETQVEGRPLCRTTLNWASDARTLGQAGLTAAQWAVHQHTLELAVRSRAALLRTLTLTVQSAVKIALVLTLPGGALLALPPAWKFIQEVLAGLDQRPQPARP